MPATIKNITVGKSKRSDLIKHWGKPFFEQEFAEDGDAEEISKLETKTELGYQDIEINDLKPNIGVLIGDKSQIVSCISLFFYEMSKKEAVEIYGSDYYPISSTESTCVNSSQKKRDESKLAYPINLVYPAKGMFITIRDDNSVISINFTDKCS